VAAEKADADGKGELAGAKGDFEGIERESRKQEPCCPGN